MLRWCSSPAQLDLGGGLTSDSLSSGRRRRFRWRDDSRERWAGSSERVRAERHTAAPLLAPWQRHQAFDVCRLPDSLVRIAPHGHRDDIGTGGVERHLLYLPQGLAGLAIDLGLDGVKSDSLLR